MGWNKTTCDEDHHLINNRQQNGRRRGRGGGPRVPGGSPNPGNRQDNRSRGNAAQLHEKYKSLARDAQLAGDRVQTEYYLQFADHYFRVLSEGRARFEEQRRPRDEYGDEDEDGDEGQFASDGDEEQQRQPREQQQRNHREPREQNADQGGDRQERFERGERPERVDRERNAGEAGEGRRRRGRRDRNEGPERADAPAEDSADERISLDVLPPAIAPVGEGAEVVKVARRRTRRVKPEGEAEVAPAA